MVLNIFGRYIDMIYYGRKMQRETKIVKIGEGSLIRRRTPKGESFAVLQMVKYPKKFLSINESSK